MCIKFPGLIFPLVAACLLAACSLGWADDGLHLDYPNDMDGLLDVLADPQEPVVRFAREFDLRNELALTQPQPQPPQPPQPAPPELTAAARRRGRTYRLPSMFGDFYGGEFLTATFFPDNSTSVMVDVPLGGGVRRVKVTENNSAIPRDRCFFNYNFFNDVFGGIGDVNRYTLGMERTFFDESSSIDVRVPFGATLDADQLFGGPRGTDTQVGALTVILKTILLEREQFLVSAGLGVTVPLEEGGQVFQRNGPQLIDIKNESVHLLPYLGFVYVSDSPWYLQGFLQLDVDANGNPVSGGGTVRVLQDQTLLFADVGAGYWITGPPNAAGSPSVAVTAEVHYATTLENSDFVVDPNFVLINVANRYDVLNLTLGAIFNLNSRVTIRPAMVVPLNDDQFDYEAIVQANFWR